MELTVGSRLRGKEIRAVRQLSNGWLLLKTEDGKSPADFRVKVVTRTKPRIRSVTPKHAHFLIDYYGKKCSDPKGAEIVFRGLIRTWGGESSSKVTSEIVPQALDLPGYPIEYILGALEWILEQEDINFTDRPIEKQVELDATLTKAGVKPLENRRGSELAVSLFCNVELGMHPVEAFLRAQLDVIPVKRARGAV